MRTRREQVLMQLAAGSGSCSLVPALLCDDVRQEGFRSSTPTHPRPGHPNARGVPCFPNTPGQSCIYFSRQA